MNISLTFDISSQLINIFLKKVMNISLTFYISKQLMNMGTYYSSSLSHSVQSSQCFQQRKQFSFFSATGKRSAVKLSPFLEWTGHCCPTTWKEKQKLCDISLMLDFWHIGRVFLWNIWNICPGLPTLASSLGVGVWNKNQEFRFSRYLKAIFASSHKSKQSASMLYIQNIPKILVQR